MYFPFSVAVAVAVAAAYAPALSSFQALDRCVRLFSTDALLLRPQTDESESCAQRPQETNVLRVLTFLNFICTALIISLLSIHPAFPTNTPTFFSLLFPLRAFILIPSLDGFFDAGMLRQALNANRQDQAAEPAVDREVVRRNVGRRLRLSEY